MSYASSEGSNDTIKSLVNFHKSFSLQSGSKKENLSSCMGSKITELEQMKRDLRQFHESFRLIGDCNGTCKSQSHQQLNGHSSVSDGHASTGCSGDGSHGYPRQAPQTLSLSTTTHSKLQANVNGQRGPSPIQDRVKKRSRKKRGQPPLGPVSFEMTYELTGEVLGAGMMSTVATCRSRRNGKEYAAKIVANSSKNVRDRVLKEVEILYICRNSRNFLQLIDFFESKEKFHLVLEKMKGPLLGLIQQKERFTEREASMVTREVALALSFLHRNGIAHRDLKPDNILCERDDQVIPIKICDFDLSNMVPTKTTPTSTPLLLTPVGSAEYMAPEVVDTFRGDVFAYDKKCDLWSLGVILYMMLSGRPPFYGRCGRECGWERGGECEECQSMLLDKIRNSDYSFRGKEWSDISQRATQLISQLLEHDVEKRLTAQQVLLHPWISEQAAPETPLATPGLLRRNSSIPEELSLYCASCLRCNRRLSSTHEVVPTLPSHMNNQEHESCRPFTLSPPGSSELAIRRTSQHSSPISSTAE